MRTRHNITLRVQWQFFKNEPYMYFSYPPFLPHGQPPHFHCFDDNSPFLKNTESYRVISRLCRDTASYVK